jgi:predicted ester cyclase
MKAGVVKGRLKADRIAEAIEVFTTESAQSLAGIPGCVDVQFWVDRESGEFLGLGIYENEEARSAAGRVLAEMAPELADSTEDATPQREVYELASSIAMGAQAIVEKIIGAINSGDLEQVARDLAPEVRLSYERPGGAEHRGPQAVKEHYQGWCSAFPDLHVQASRVVATSDTVIVEGQFSGTHSGTLATRSGDVTATGRSVSGGFVQVFTISGGMVSEIHTYADYASLLMQLGVAPSQVRTST